jgi:hypothetical protein
MTRLAEIISGAIAMAIVIILGILLYTGKSTDGIGDALAVIVSFYFINKVVQVAQSSTSGSATTPAVHGFSSTTTVSDCATPAAAPPAAAIAPVATVTPAAPVSANPPADAAPTDPGASTAPATPTPVA